METLHVDSNRSVGTTLGVTKKPTIKPRLEALIDRLGLLCARLDQLDHNIAGNGGLTEASPSPAPFAIPDQLELIETLVHRALDHAATISDRF